MTGAEIVQQLSEQSVTRQLLTDAPQWPYGHVSVEEAKSNRRQVVSHFVSTSNPTSIPLRQVTGPLSAEYRLVYTRNPLNSLTLMKGDGTARRRVALNRTNRYGSSLSRNRGWTYGKARGHLILVSFGQEIVALNALPREADDGMEILWRQNVSPVLPGAVTGRQQFMPEVRTAPWGETHRLAKTGGRPVGSMGTLSDYSVCFQVGQELRCVDLRTGEPLWLRDAVGLGSELFGDDKLVFAVAHGETTARVFSRIDGTELGQRKVPPSDRRWATLGRNILTWESDNGAIRLRMVDPWKMEDVWSHSFSAGMKGQLLEREGEFAAYERNGRFRLIDLSTGEQRMEKKLQPLPDLNLIHVATYVDQYILFTSRPGTTSRRRTTLGIQVNGPVYAIERSTGELSWPAPAYLDNYIFPPDQPRDLPFLALLHNRAVKQANRSPRTMTSLLVIDRRDGREVYQHDLGKASSNVQLVATDGDSRRNLAAMMQGGATFRFTLDDVPRSPEPPIQTGRASSISVDPTKSKMADSTGNAIKAIGRIAKEILDPNPAQDPFDGKAKP